MKIPLAFILLIVLNPLHLWSMTDPDDRSRVIELDNGAIVRDIKIEQGTISSTGLFMAGRERNYIRESGEFSFLANDRPVRKWLKISNRSEEDLKIEALNVEDL